MTPTPTQDPKRLLAELIDAYASAKVSGNEMLMKMAIGPLNEFIVNYDFMPITASAPPLEGDE